MYPQKLKVGDEIRVVAPSSSLGIISRTNVTRAQERLSALGFKITFGQYVREKDSFDSSSIRSRISDLHTAFQDTSVKAILCVIGGYNANQLLDYLDYGLIRRNPKIFCGYSDITVLTNAIYARSDLVTYSGPSFSSFAMKRGFDYSLEYFLKCLADTKPLTVWPSPRWSDDEWHKNQSKRTFVRNRGLWPLRLGTARGKTVGGNLCTFNLLQGTRYMPSLRNAILFIEDDDLVKGAVFAKEFGRNLQYLVQQPSFRHVRGLVFGRFQKKCLMTDEKLRALLATIRELQRIPILAGVDFGHTTPQITLPIGGEVRIVAGSKRTRIEILKH